MIYTSRYSNPLLKTGNYTVVGVTRGAPKFALKYDLAGNILDIAPPGYLFNEYNRERFTPRYFRHMDEVGVAKVRKELSKYTAKGRDVVLCCFEDVRNPDDWCHRLVFAEWWKARTGEDIKELEDTSPNKWEKKAAKPARPLIPEEPPMLQMSMW